MCSTRTRTHNLLINGTLTYSDHSPFRWIHVVITTSPKRPTNTMSQAQAEARKVLLSPQRSSNANDYNKPKVGQRHPSAGSFDYSCGSTRGSRRGTGASRCLREQRRDGDPRRPLSPPRGEKKGAGAARELVRSLLRDPEPGGLNGAADREA